MKISNHKDLPINKELWLGNDSICNRYLRRENGIIEAQRIVRYGKNGETDYMTPEDFDTWRAELREIASSENVGL